MALSISSALDCSDVDWCVVVDTAPTLVPARTIVCGATGYSGRRGRRIGLVAVLELGAQPPQQRVVAQRAAGCGGTSSRSTRRCRTSTPIIRSTMVTCRARQLAASSSCWSSASLTAHTSAYCDAVVGDGPQRLADLVVGVRREPVGDGARRGTRPTGSARRAGRRSRACSASVSPLNRSTYAGSLAPERNSSSRNCTDWKPLAGASRCRNSRKSCGVIVSSTSIWCTSTRSMTCTRCEQVLGPPQPARRSSRRARRPPRAAAA